eukprot:129764-Chlamydomonas_euryale.AAC.1
MEGAAAASSVGRGGGRKEGASTAVTARGVPASVPAGSRSKDDRDASCGSVPESRAVLRCGLLRCGGGGFSALLVLVVGRRDGRGGGKGEGRGVSCALGWSPMCAPRWLAGEAGGMGEEEGGELFERALLCRALQALRLGMRCRVAAAAFDVCRRAAGAAFESVGREVRLARSPPHPAAERG